ncbi:2-keto-4-pentenoate hydratase/2-oxohepta-3-ene-1,7-dioic acid hydratase in catechol pathway [Breznakibacter xylanolyticus]|uniref:2-keto-4-pentenoate hydratase/2-oxohepta-3-ene-1,7-dioic acid hydratase in catechol pathway n=1 Tax=Breznakibacter xylanolyticus TaxID=990 RepID=A0A2W7ND20_9BACT|nr:fumarylacetoacetate hydrolase family protein [Breznakibacter xylanolyticus]MBN2742609.1 fumarylacetoacetate hydrolase family protein [Marinilabiliaceae bacterium]PZX18048.1 2-keto-4-pentenoate hydratase/2-oxohepta-3-ene-1,7-dioic acid hydratase in catechol pathway [Breznakibacter xylanolyticus]
MKIICIGRNYEAHARELKNPLPPEPVVFCKPDTALLRNNNPFFIPDFANDFHHEVEVLVRINRLGKNIDERFAHRYYDEVGLGIDFTARDLQDDLRAKGQPWEKCKAFDGSAVISEFVSKERFADVQNIDFRLDINDQTRQKGNTRDMLFSIDAIIAHVSKFFTLKIGDIIFTGTPEGVGSVKINDRLKGYIGDELFFDFLVK